MPYDTTRAAKALKSDGWRKVNGKWHPPARRSIFLVRDHHDDEGREPDRLAKPPSSWRGRGDRSGSRVKVVALAPTVLIGTSVAGRLHGSRRRHEHRSRPGSLPAAGVDARPASAARTCPASRAWCWTSCSIAARKPGTLAERRGAWAKLETFLSRSQVSSRWPSATTRMVVSDRVVGPRPHLLGDLSDRFWDVLTWRLASAG